MDAHKQLIVKLGAVLIAILLFLTFFSRTIYSLNLPGITVDFPSDGVIIRTSRAEGVVEFSDYRYLYAENAGKVSILVTTGERVTTGTPLYTLRADVNDLQERLQTETNRLDKIIINIEKTEADLAYQRNKLETLTPESVRATQVEPPDLAHYDYESTRLTKEIEKAEAEYNAALLLLEANVVSQSEVNKYKSTLDSLRLAYNRNAEEKVTAAADYEKALSKAAEDDKLNRDERQKAYEAEQKLLLKTLEELRYQMETLKLDESESQQTVNRLTEQIEADGVETVHAEQSGIVRDIPTGMENGAFIDRNSLVMRIGVTESNDYAYKTTVSFSDSVDYIEAGQMININIRSSRLYGLNGMVESIRFANGRLNADVLFNADGLTGGEKTEIVAEQVSQLYGFVLPNSAIHIDKSEGDYILYAERVNNTLMGYAYYTRRMPIIIFEQDENNTAFNTFSSLEAPVIINSDRPIAANDRVRLVGGDEIIGAR